MVGMEEPSTLFQYLYTTLTAEIHTEKLRYGERLPSIRELCRIYNVGIRTVNDVLKALNDNGYIKTEIRKNATVIYRNDELTDSLRAKQLLARKEAVVDLLKTMGCFFPHIIASGAMMCDTSHLEEMIRSARGLTDKPIKEKWRVSTHIIQQIISFHGNRLLTELFINMNIYGQVPVLEGFKNPFLDMTWDRERNISYLFDAIKAKDYEGLYTRIEELYVNGARKVEKYLEELAEIYPQFSNLEKSAYQWDARNGRVFLYMEISRQLASKIGKNIYPVNGSLPTIMELADEYAVSPSTVRKALGVLNTLGIVRTVKKAGSIVTLNAAASFDIQIKDAVMKRDAVTFLSALHMCAMTCRTIALLGFDRLEPETIHRLVIEGADEDNRSVAFILIKALVKAQPYNGIREIYAQMELLLSWGYYFSFAQRNKEQYQFVHEKSKTALQFLLIKEKTAFADIIQEIYMDIFTLIRNTLVSYGAMEGICLAPPAPDTFEKNKTLLH